MPEKKKYSFRLARTYKPPKMGFKKGIKMSKFDYSVLYIYRHPRELILFLFAWNLTISTLLYIYKIKLLLWKFKKCPKNGQKWPKMANYANFGP